MAGRRHVINELLLVLTAVLFSTGGAAIKLTTLNEWQVASFRSGVAAVVLLATLPEARRWSWRLIPVAGAYASTLVLFVVANKLTTAANAIFLQSTAPFYVLLLGPVWLGERARRSDVAYLAFMAAGMLLVFVDTFAARSTFATAPSPARGNELALLSGVAWAFTIMGLRWIGRGRASGSPVAAAAAGNVLACVATLPMSLPVDAPGGANIAIVVYLGAVQIGLAYALLSRAIRRVTAFEATAVLLVEPVMNPIWAWMVHGERPGLSALAGGSLILSATFLHARKRGRESFSGSHS